MNYQIEGLTISVANIDAMRQFYEAVFGIEFEARELFGGTLYSGFWGGFKLLLCPEEISGFSAERNRHQFDLFVDDIESAIAAVEHHGGQCMGAPETEGIVASCGILDPDGNTMVIKQFVETPVPAM